MTEANNGKTGAGKLEPRDFINIGVFTALMFAIIWATGMLGFFGPAMMIAGFALSVLANGVVFALFTARTPKMGALAVMLVICEVLFALTGHWAGGIAMGLVFGALADLTVSKGPKSARIRIPIAYSLFSLPIYASPMLPVFFDAKAYMSGIADQMGADYAAQMAAVFTPGNLVIMFAAMMALSLLAGRFGVAVGRRHFERAGLL